MARAQYLEPLPRADDGSVCLETENGLATARFSHLTAQERATRGSPFARPPVARFRPPLISSELLGYGRVRPAPRVKDAVPPTATSYRPLDAEGIRTSALSTPGGLLDGCEYPDLCTYRRRPRLDARTSSAPAAGSCLESIETGVPEVPRFDDVFRLVVLDQISWQRPWGFLTRHPARRWWRKASGISGPRRRAGPYFPAELATPTLARGRAFQRQHLVTRNGRARQWWSRAQDPDHAYVAPGQQPRPHPETIRSDDGRFAAPRSLDRGAVTLAKSRCVLPTRRW